jgi:serine/threonine protein kinase
MKGLRLKGCFFFLLFLNNFFIDEFLEEIGRGSFGSVFKAVHLATHIAVAIKMISFSFSFKQDNKEKEESDRELQNFMKLRGKSPYLVDMIECFEDVYNLFN